MAEARRWITHLHWDQTGKFYVIQFSEDENGPYILYTDHAARVAELEAALKIAEESDAESIRMYRSARDRAERAEAEVAKRNAALLETEPPFLPDANLIALLPKWAEGWIIQLKHSLSVAQDQAMENGQAARSAEAEARGLREAIKDFAAHGLRCDMNPTHDMSSQETSETFWHDYFRRADDFVRMRAKAALKDTP